VSLAYAACAVVLALSLALPASDKLIRDERQAAIFHESYGIPVSWLPFMAASELAEAAGLLAGMFFRTLGVVSAALAVIYFAYTPIAHSRTFDLRGALGALLLWAVGAAALIVALGS
jgi:hypothetical protein